MNFDPQRLFNILLLRAHPKSAEGKRYGTFNRRMIAAAIDSLLIMGLASPLIDYWYAQHYGAPTMPIQAVFARAQQAVAEGGSATSALLQGLQDSGHWARLVANTKWQFYIYAVYSVVCWHFWNATLGKLICRLQVVDAKTGGRMSDWQSIMRVLGYVPSAMFLGLGFFWIGANKKRKGWHDYFAGTEVIIKLKAAPENPQ